MLSFSFLFFFLSCHYKLQIFKKTQLSKKTKLKQAWVIFHMIPSYCFHLKIFVRKASCLKKLFRIQNKDFSQLTLLCFPFFLMATFSPPKKLYQHSFLWCILLWKKKKLTKKVDFILLYKMYFLYKEYI